MRTGVIIAGGRSTRFGEADKALADLAGRPMVRRVADRMVDVVDALVVNCRADQADGVREAMAGYPREVRLALDENPDQGPMAGIRTGLRAAADLAAAGAVAPEREPDSAEDGLAFVAACDMPFVDPAVVEYLFERAAGRDAAVPQLDDRWFQTTHAVYHAARMADACDRALAAGERKIIEPLFDLDYVVVDEAEVRERGNLRTFENLNTREEFEAAAEALADTADPGDATGDSDERGRR